MEAVDGEARWEELEIALVGRTANVNEEKPGRGARCSTRPVVARRETPGMGEMAETILNLLKLWLRCPRTNAERLVLMQAVATVLR